jgi:hypothetical protein
MYILRPFGLFYCHLVYMLHFGIFIGNLVYNFPDLVCCAKKNLATLDPCVIKKYSKFYRGAKQKRDSVLTANTAGARTGI